MKYPHFVLSLFALGTFALPVTHAEKLVTQSARISFFSSTPAEDISSVNHSVVSTLDPAIGQVAYSVPMQSFSFEKSLMQRHFNQAKFLDTKTHPHATFQGQIQNLAAIDFTTDGVYPTTISGVLTIKGVAREVTESGTLTVRGDTVLAESSFALTLADFGVTFTGGKPAKNIAKTVTVTITAPYSVSGR